MIYYIIVSAILLAVFIFVSFKFFRKKFSLKSSLDDCNEISPDRVKIIKEKYKSIEKMRKMKKVTKEDVENFYRSQSND